MNIIVSHSSYVQSDGLDRGGGGDGGDIQRHDGGEIQRHDGGGGGGGGVHGV